MNTRRFQTAILLLIAAAFFVVHLVGIKWGLPSAERSQYYPTEAKWYSATQMERLYLITPIESYHPDEGRILNALSHMNPGHLDLNPHYFNYPSLYIYMTGAALAGCRVLGCIDLVNSKHYYVTHPDAIAQSFVLGRLVALLLGSICIFVVGLSASLLFRPSVGLISALTLAFTPLWVRDSYFMAVNVPSVALMCIAFLLAVLAIQRQSIALVMVGAFVSGLAASTKYPVGTIWIVQIFALYRILSPKTLLDRRFLSRSFLSGVITFIAFLIGTPYALLSFSEFRNDVIYEGGDKLGLPIIGQLLNNFVVTEGTVMAVLLIIGCILVVSRIKQWNYTLLILGLLCGVLSILSKANYVRYFLPLVPMLAIVAGITLDALWRLLQAQSNGLARFSWLIVVVLLLPGLLYSADIIRIMSQPVDIRDTAAAWVTANIPAGSSIGIVGKLYYDMPPLNAEKYKLVNLNDAPPDADTRTLIYTTYTVEPNPITSAGLDHAAGANVQTFAAYPASQFIFPVTSLPEDWGFTFETIYIIRRS